MSVVVGNDILIMTGSTTQGGGTLLGAMKSCEMSVKADTLETCSSDSNEWRTFVAGRKEWSVSSNHLVQTMYSHLMSVGTEVVIQFRARDNSRDAVYGTAICTEASIVGSRGNLATGSFKFKGTGELTSMMS